MPVKVYIKPIEGGYRASCQQFGFEVDAKTKEEASGRMNEKIKERVEAMKAAGKLSEKAPAACSPQDGCSQSGCSGCGDK